LIDNYLCRSIDFSHRLVDLVDFHRSIAFSFVFFDFESHQSPRLQMFERSAFLKVAKLQTMMLDLQEVLKLTTVTTD